MNGIITHIEDVLGHLPSTPSNRILLRVPNHLRRVKKEAYEPDIISIGPYHRGKDHLAAMEEHNSVAKYVEALSKLNKIAKNSYEERFLEERREQFLEEKRPDDFLETMLVDACFIVELIRKSVAENVSIQDDDPIFRSEMTLYSLKHDLLLLENQLPFFILQNLFNMTLLPNEESNLVDMIFRFFTILPGPGYKRSEEHNLPKVPVRHLLGVKAYLNKTEQENQKTNGFRRVQGCSIFDIKFANGVLEIPKLTIDDKTESLLRNLIAYEQFWKDDIYQAIDYTMFMDCLINSKKDVELLCRMVANICSRLLDNVRIYHERSFYSEIYLEVNKYCSSRKWNLWKAKLGGKWNVWKATLRRDYFNGPWALISFLAAVFLLLFTAVQTVYSVLSYHHS
ncbi:hypothetical protein K2173_012232 [Erythroxylum novogranatense]|uniref:Uncharacterized protein n=1 Tax=Erythroxylum novogranatense TaxID=1862640 RepID=A0AAV8T906_9ROSI|nr:hypothetical protein K2173_012232 [Erythroxylum novogranatense]